MSSKKASRPLPRSSIMWIPPRDAPPAPSLGETLQTKLNGDCLAFVVSYLSILDLRRLYQVGNSGLWQILRANVREIGIESSNWRNDMVALPAITFDPFPVLQGFTSLHTVILHRVSYIVPFVVPSRSPFALLPSCIRHFEFQTTEIFPNVTHYYILDYQAQFPNLEVLRLSFWQDVNHITQSEDRWTEFLPKTLNTLSLVGCLHSPSRFLQRLCLASNPNGPAAMAQAALPEAEEQDRRDFLDAVVGDAPIDLPLLHSLEISICIIDSTLPEIPRSLTAFRNVMDGQLETFRPFLPFDASDPGLRDLDISILNGMPLSDELFTSLPKSLRKLRVRSMGINSNISVAAYQGLPSLTEFDHIHDQTMIQVLDMPNIRTLKISSVHNRDPAPIFQQPSTVIDLDLNDRLGWDHPFSVLARGIRSFKVYVRLCDNSVFNDPPPMLTRLSITMDTLHGRAEFLPRTLFHLHIVHKQNIEITEQDYLQLPPNLQTLHIFSWTRKWTDESVSHQVGQWMPRSLTECQLGSIILPASPKASPLGAFVNLFKSTSSETEMLVRNAMALFPDECVCDIGFIRNSKPVAMSIIRRAAVLTITASRVRYHPWRE